MRHAARWRNLPTARRRGYTVLTLCKTTVTDDFIWFPNDSTHFINPQIIVKERESTVQLFRPSRESPVLPTHRTGRDRRTKDKRLAVEHIS